MRLLRLRWRLIGATCLVVVVMLACGGSDASPTGQTNVCPSASPDWKLVRVFDDGAPGEIAYNVWDGYATSACTIILVGAQGPIQPHVPTVPPDTGSTPPPQLPTFEPLGEPYALINSEDGGASLTVEHSFPNQLRSVTFTGDRTGWLRERSTQLEQNYYRSTDGGRSWQLIRIDPVREPTVAVSGHNAFFAGEEFVGYGRCSGPGIASGDIYANEWRLVHRVESGGGCFSYNDIDARGQVVAAVGTTSDAGLLTVSRDGGTSFEDIRFPPTQLYQVFEVSIVGNQGVLVRGTSGYTERPQEPHICRLLRMAAPGDSWQEIKLPAGVKCLRDLTFISPTKGYAVVDGGYAINGVTQATIAVTDDGGLAWRLSPLGPEVGPAIDGIFAADDGTVYAHYYKNLYRGRP